MKVSKLSRGTTIDTEQCVQHIGNRFELVIAAAVRARELARQHRKAEIGTQLNAPVTALLEIQAGKFGREYLKKVQ
jgi:DNA-directed RNA polymerase subunit omega